MDKKELKDRLDKLKKLQDSHKQDIIELGFVIDGLEKTIKKLEE